MPFVHTVPEMLSAVAGNLHAVGETLNAQNAAAAPSTTCVVPAAADEVSALTAMQFAAHAYLYQSVSAHAAVVHHMFMTALAAASASYAATEAANAVATS